LAFLWVILLAPAARGQELGTLDVERAAGAESCPGAPELARKVTELEPGAELRPGPASGGPHFRVQIERRPEHWRARIQVSGARQGDRTLTDSGEGCAALGDAVALTLAMLLAPLDDEPQPEPVEEAPPRPQPVSPVARETRAPSASEPTGFGLALRAGPAATLGLLERAGGALFAELELEPAPALTTSLGLLWAPAQSIEHGPGRVEVSLAALLLSTCLEVVEAGSLQLSLCAVQAAGQIRGSGHDYSAYTDSAARPWLAAGGGARGSTAITGPLGWTIGLIGLVPLTSERFTIEGVSGAAYEPSPVALVAEVGLRLSIW
jgi:hypothetical protein